MWGSEPAPLALTPPKMPKAQHTVASKVVCDALRSGGHLEDHMVNLSFWPMLMNPPVDSKQIVVKHARVLVQSFTYVVSLASRIHNTMHVHGCQPVSLASICIMLELEHGGFQSEAQYITTLIVLMLQCSTHHDGNSGSSYTRPSHLRGRGGLAWKAVRKSSRGP